MIKDFVVAYVTIGILCAAMYATEVLIKWM
jgi:hypothetical protein